MRQHMLVVSQNKGSLFGWFSAKTEGKHDFQAPPPPQNQRLGDALRGGGPSVQAEPVAALGCAAPAPAEAKLAVQAGRLLWLTFIGGAKFAERKDLKDAEEVLHKRHEGKSHLRNTPLIDMEPKRRSHQKEFPLGWGPSQSTPKPEGQMI